MFKYLFSVICVVILLFVYGLFNDDVNILDYERSSSCLQLQVEVLTGRRIHCELFQKSRNTKHPPPTYCVPLQSSEFLHSVFWVYNLSIHSVYLKI
jgi:hypothetical protein